MGDSSNETNPTIKRQSALEKSLGPSMPRRDPERTFVVERIGRASRVKEEPPPALQPEQQSFNKAGEESRCLTEPEQRARLSALEEAQRRGPDERRLAQERSQHEAIQDLKGQAAGLQKQLAATLAEKESERLRAAELARTSDALRLRCDALEKDVERERTSLRKAENAARERDDSLAAERIRSQKLVSELSAARNEAAGAEAHREEMKQRLAKTEGELASYRSRPWWRRLID